MKIFLDIGHPAHVHYFRNFIKIMRGRGHRFMITAKERNVTHSLLETYGIPFVKRRDYPKSLLSKLLMIPVTDVQILRHARRFRPDLFMGFSGTHVSHAGWLMNRPRIIFDDTDHAGLAHASYVPFASVILTPDCFTKAFGKKHLRFKGYMELCGLHPNYFSPDRRVLKDLGVHPSEKYVLVRFVSWTASHDIGHRGLSREMKIRAVREFSLYAKVFITAEADLPVELEKYRLSVPPDKMHDVMAHATLFYGESATMASESAVLGVPAVYINEAELCYTVEEEKKYGLVFNFNEPLKDQEQSIIKAVDILKSPDSREKYGEKRRRLIREKIDVTAFMVWFVETYPESFEILKKNPEHQNVFMSRP
jgi:uncharacterized protein